MPDETQVLQGGWRKPYKKWIVDSREHKVSGRLVHVHVDPKLGDFFAVLDVHTPGEALGKVVTVTGPSKGVVMQRALKEMDALYSLRWEQVIAVRELQHNDHSTFDLYDEERNDADPFVGIQFRRFLLATRPDGEQRERPWGPERTRFEEEFNFVDVGQPYRPWHRERVIPYTPAAWEGLTNIRDQIKALNRQVRAFLKLDIGAFQDRLVIAAAKTLPPLIAGPVANAVVDTGQEWQGSEEPRPLTDLVRNLAEWLFAGQHSDAIGTTYLMASTPDVGEVNGEPRKGVLRVMVDFHVLTVNVQRDGNRWEQTGRPDERYAKPGEVSAYDRAAFSDAERDIVVAAIEAGCLSRKVWTSGGFSLSVGLDADIRASLQGAIDRIAEGAKLPPEEYRRRRLLFKVPDGWRCRV